MKPVLSALLILVLFPWSAAVWAAPGASGEMEATTPGGEKVILYPDGTWKYKTPPLVTETKPGSFIADKPSSASAVLNSNKKFVSLWYDEDKWKPMDASPVPQVEFFLVHDNGEAYASLAAERISVATPQALKEISLKMMSANADSFSVLWEEERIINGRPVVAVRADVKVQGIDLAYYFYYWAGKAGNVVLSSWTGRYIIDDYSGDMLELLSGLVVNRD